MTGQGKNTSRLMRALVFFGLIAVLAAAGGCDLLQAEQECWTSANAVLPGVQEDSLVVGEPFVIDGSIETAPPMDSVYITIQEGDPLPSGEEETQEVFWQADLGGGRLSAGTLPVDTTLTIDTFSKAGADSLWMYLTIETTEPDCGGGGATSVQVVDPGS